MSDYKYFISFIKEYSLIHYKYNNSLSQIINDFNPGRWKNQLLSKYSNNKKEKLYKTLKEILNIDNFSKKTFFKKKLIYY